VIIYAGAIAPEAEAALASIKGAGLLAITSADKLFADWSAQGQASWISKLLADAPKGEPLITVIDGHPAALAWLGSVDGRRVEPLGVDQFGQCGDLPTLYRKYEIDAEAIIAKAG
jgi:pyruvate dehydrogenase E1 component